MTYSAVSIALMVLYIVCLAAYFYFAAIRVGERPLAFIGAAMFLIIGIVLFAHPH